MFGTAILIILGSFLWRLRGGLLNDLTGQENYPVLGVPFNDTVVRILWSGGMALGMFAFGDINHGLLSYGVSFLSWYYHIAVMWGTLLATVIVALTLFFGTTAVGWMGYNLEPTKLTDVVGLGKSGIMRTALTSVVLLSPWPVLSGVCFGPSYWLGYKIPRLKPWMFWGEIVCGAQYGFFLSLIHFL